MRPISYWDSTFPKAATAACADTGSPPTGAWRAWKVASGVTGCFDDAPFDTWKGRVWSIDLLFTPAVPASRAITVVTGLLGIDARSAGQFSGANRSDSSKPNGSCEQFVWSSASFGKAVAATDPQWPDDPKLINAMIYSGAATSADGSLTTLDAQRVRYVLLDIGGANRGADGYVGC